MTTLPTVDATFTAHQPMLLPPLYICNRLAYSSAYVYMSSAQFTRGSGQNTFLLQDKEGVPRKFTLPVQSAGRQPVYDVRVHDPVKSLSALFETVRHLYSRTRYWASFKDSFEETIRDLQAMSDLRLHATGYTLNHLVFSHIGLNVDVYRDESLVTRGTEDASDWIASMGAALKCKDAIGSPTGKVFYLCGGANLHDGYLRQEAFTSRDIQPVGQNYKIGPDKFKELGADRTQPPFSANPATLSVLDSLLRHGPEITWKLLNLSPYMP